MRQFEYIIVCPETIKSTWLDESAKMGFSIDKRYIINYEEVDGLIQAKKFNISGKNVVFDEAHNLCRTMRRDGMRYYPEVLARLKESDKLLLLTGTPEHSGHSDFTLLINMAVGRTEFPLNDEDFQKKYRDMTIFEKRKNDIMFNWFKPVAWHYLNVALSMIGNIILRYMRRAIQAYCIRKQMRILIPTQKFIKAARKNNQMMIQPNYTHAHGGVFNNMYNTLKKEAKDLKSELLPSAPLNGSDFLSQASESVLGLDELFEGMEYSAQVFDEMLWNMPGQAFWGVIYKYVMTTCQFLRVTHDPREALKEAKLDIDKYTKDIGRYVSFYVLDNNNVNYAEKMIDEKPIEALYSTYQSRQCLYFIFATMDLKMVQTFADCNKEMAMLKIVEFRSNEGVRKYGRCVSNMWPIVTEIRKKRVRYVFDAKDGTAKLRYTRKGLKHQRKKNKSKAGGLLSYTFITPDQLGGCSKFEGILKMLQTAETNDERTLIRSDFKAQGIYLLSAYLNAHGIAHYYIQKSDKNEESRTRILNEYNNVYRHVKVDGQSARLIRDYVVDNEPLDSVRQLMQGVLVMMKPGTTIPKSWKGISVAQVVEVNSQNQTCVVIPKGLSASNAVPMSDLARVYTIQYDTTSQIKQVRAHQIEYPLPKPDPKTSPRKVMLLDNDSSEGISLMGVEHVHLLEPLLNVAQRDQALARAVRFRSHLHLPPERRRVHIYTHVGVIRPTKLDMDRGKAYMQQQMFDIEKNEHINKHFSGLVPRAAKGSAFDNPMAFAFDKYWNTVESIHPEIEAAGTPDLLVYKDLSASSKHIGRMTNYIRQTNVLANTFKVPDDCELNETFSVKTDNYSS